MTRRGRKNALNSSTNSSGSSLEMLDLVPAGGRAIIAHAQYGLAAVAASRHQFKQAQILAQRSYKAFEQLGHREKKMVHAFLEQISKEKEQ